MSWLTWVPLAFVIGGGCWLRVKIATGELLWLDELHTSWAVQDSFPTMLQRSANGNQAPLFFTLVWLVTKYLGATEFSLRLVSLVAGSLLMPVAARAVYIWNRSAIAATLAAALIAVDDTFIWYATEARPYALWQLLGLCQIVAFRNALVRLGAAGRANNSTKVPKVLVVLSLAMLYTHYASIFLLGVEFVVLLISIVYWRVRFRIEWRPLGPPVGWATVWIVALALPLFGLMRQAYGQPDDWKAVVSVNRFAGEQFSNALVWFFIPTAIVVCAGIFRRFCLAGEGASGAIAGESSNRDLARIWQLVFLVVMFCLPVVVVYVLAVADWIPIAMSRYVMASAVAGPLFSSYLVGGPARRQQWIVAMLIVFATVGFYIHQKRLVARAIWNFRIPLLRTEDWVSPIEMINRSEAKQLQPVLLFGSIVEDSRALENPLPSFQRYLQFPLRSSYQLTERKRRVWAGPTMTPPHVHDVVLQEVVDRRGAWIVVRHHRSHALSIAERISRKLKSQSVAVAIAEYGSPRGLVWLISIDVAAVPE